MTKVITGTIKKGKIIPHQDLPQETKNGTVKIFIFTESPSKKSFFGKCKGVFGDALKFQKHMRREWK